MFYEFEDIFHKHLGNNLSFIIGFKQSLKRNGAAIDENDLEGYDFNFDQDLEDFC